MPDDQDQLSQHWKELAAQLGLEPAEASGSPPSPKDDEVAAPKARTIQEERLAPLDEATSSTFEPAPVKAPDSDQFVGVTEAAGEQAVSLEEIRDKSRPSHRGRRGRGTERSGREISSHRKRDSGFRAREETPVSASEDMSQAKGPEIPRESEISEEPEPAFVDDIPAAENRKEEDESDTDDVDTLSDWNVPSWAELIASLYRPER